VIVRLTIISKDGLLYKLDKLCVPKGEILQLIREAHTSKVARHFGVGKTSFQLTKVCVLA
jgi:hypothetical protein